MTDSPRVLVADDEVAMRELVAATLELRGFEVVGAASDGKEAIRLFESLDPPPSAVVLDQRMPGLTGIETAERILAIRPNQVIVLFSAALTVNVVSDALNVGVLQCIDKLEVTRLPQVLSVLLGL
jgi:DNA-binding NarL/FixJ family response regulator